MGAKSAFLLTASLCTLSLQCLIITTKADEALIKKLCNVTPAPGICESCLDSDPRSKSADEIGLAVIDMACAANEMSSLYQNTLSYRKNTTDPNMKEALLRCLEHMDISKNMTNEAEAKVKSKDFKLAQGIIEFHILAGVFYCPGAIHSRSHEVPEVISKGIDDIGRDWKNVLAILGSIK